ncbi:MAG: ATP-binding protein [Gemmatimonadales bacterium]
MTRRVPIRMNVANALQWLGTLYRNPADAVKEHVSNAIDEHLKAVERGDAHAQCTVTFRLQKKDVTIEYPYGLNRDEFESALQRVADSAKRHTDVAQIGQLGIGIFSFQQVGRKCTFYSKKDRSSETLRVILREGEQDAEFDRARKRESLEAPGIKIVISGLKFDPTRRRGPLDPDKLTRLFADKFSSYLQKGWLAIEVWRNREKHVVEPPSIDLPRIGEGLERLALPGYPRREAVLELHFDPSGKGAVSVRHSGVVVIEDLAKSAAYGLEESVYGSGFVKGSIDADFLQPLPARTGFDENQAWIGFLGILDQVRPHIEAEVEELKALERAKELSEVERRAVQLAREILDLDDFRDLELPGGLSKGRAPAERAAVTPTGERTGERSREPGDRSEPSGHRFAYEEIPFEDGASRHSRYVKGTVQANTLNPDYIAEAARGSDTKLGYATLLIGKEAISYNDRTGATDEQLERLLSFHFRLKNRLGVGGGGAKKVAPKRRTRKVREA